MEYLIDITTTVRVNLDENKFTEKFIYEFREHFYDFATIEDHAKHIAWLTINNQLREFTEGYGNISDFGIETNVNHSYSEIIEEIE